MAADLTPSTELRRLRTDPCHLQLAFEQEIMDTKLKLTRRGLGNIGVDYTDYAAHYINIIIVLVRSSLPMFEGYILLIS